ncbi:MAG: GGDEF domain-containing protein [Actinobacteria bacterium]|nr:GGDEF domain-containing protein [Actinomycetota bacterium]
MRDDNTKDFLGCEMILDKISDITRIVDPQSKRVSDHKNRDTVVLESEGHCFDFWGKGTTCKNCISMRAYNENRTFVKIETCLDRAYLITAIPCDVDDTRVVVEILKDVTASYWFDVGDGNNIDIGDFQMLIERLNEIAFIDSLTGVYNRRYIDEKLPVDLLNAALMSKEVSIIMVDIDYFKIVNDSYGHLAGDQALKKVAKTLSQCLRRDSDWVARYGGEEFLVCMPGAKLSTVIEMTEFMRESIERLAIEFEGKEFSVTGSFGIYNTKPSGRESVDDFIRIADEKLYLAKENGRNRVEY